MRQLKLRKKFLACSVVHVHVCVIIKALQAPQSQAKQLSMTFKINIHNVFIYLYKKFKEESVIS